MRRDVVKASGLSRVIRSKDLHKALRDMGMTTVGDLLTCPFEKLINNPKVLSHWSDITAAMLTLRKFYG